MYRTSTRSSVPALASDHVHRSELTKRVIKLVFPTLCSPRNTSLNFLSGLLDDEKSADDGVFGPDMTVARFTGDLIGDLSIYRICKVIDTRYRYESDRVARLNELIHYPGNDSRGTPPLWQSPLSSPSLLIHSLGSSDMHDPRVIQTVLSGIHVASISSSDISLVLPSTSVAFDNNCILEQTPKVVRLSSLPILGQADPGVKEEVHERPAPKILGIFDIWPKFEFG